MALGSVSRPSPLKGGRSMNSLKVTWILGFNGAEKAYFRGSFLTCPYTTFLSSGTATYREVFFPASHK